MKERSEGTGIDFCKGVGKGGVSGIRSSVLECRTLERHDVDDADDAET